MCLAGCHVVAKTQGYLLVCIWGSLIKFRGEGGAVSKAMPCARMDLKSFCTGKYRAGFQSLVSPSNGERFVSSWVSLQNRRAIFSYAFGVA